jgi:catechol 2,3-dioxygenase-like lactoylglutathione lyase family enzyme
VRVLATHHVAIQTANFDAMEAFYTQTLGFPVTRRWDDAGIIFIDIGSTTIELIRKADAGPSRGSKTQAPDVGLNHIALLVESTDAAFEEIQARRVSIVSPPADFKDVRIAFFTDPDGNVLELVEERGTTNDQ